MISVEMGLCMLTGMDFTHPVRMVVDQSRAMGRERCKCAVPG